MKTLTQITAVNCADDGNPSPIVTQPSFKKVATPPKFWRQRRRTARGEIFESSAGAQVLIPEADLMALVEAHEPKFCVPKPVDASPKTP